ncbi:MAG: helix-turn-helix domain-containing protein [Lachnospiraceae bacterium]
MTNIVEMQSNSVSNLEPGKFCSFDLEMIDEATTPLIHQSARFLFINGGSGTIQIQNVDYELKPGALVAISPWQISNVTKVNKTLQYYIVVYRFDIVNQLIKSFFNVENGPVNIINAMYQRPVTYCDSRQYDKIIGIFHNIRDEAGIESTITQGEPDKLSSIYLTTLLVELSVLYSRIATSNSNTQKKDQIVDRSEILQYMYNHLSSKLTLEMLSKIFYMSKSSISNYINQTTGMSFFDLLNEMRVGKTISFLLYTDLTLDELAKILGYVDASHISKIFLTRVGMRANEYRKTYQRIGDICKVKESRKAYSIVEFIFRNYKEEITPKTLANEFKISISELQQTLLYQVEKNFEDFLNYVRINHASELLLKTDKTITDIAMEIGYNSYKTFTRNFLKLRIMTPSAYRKSVTMQSGIL